MGKHTNGIHGRPGDDVYDALADLFLSDGEPAPSVAAPPSRPRPKHDEDDDQPPRLTIDTRPAARPPAVLATIGASARPDRARAEEDDDAMGARLKRASLPPARPSRATQSTSPKAEPIAKPEIESLILGHLPVVASAWATQYARIVSEREACPVAVLRIAGGYVSLDVTGADQRVEPLPDLHAAVALAAKMTDRWTLRADAITEPALADSPEVGSVTLLVGADEAAIVAAYRTLKGLAAPRHAHDDDGAPRRVRVSIMGAAGERADEAFQKIERAARLFLGLEVQRGHTVERIEPAAGVTLFRGEVSEPLDSLIALVARVIRQTPRAEAPAATRPTAPVPAPPAAHNGRAEPPSAPAEAALASHIAGLRPLRARCPYEPRVELAVGEDGRLHVLEHASDATLSSLLTATAWGAAHAGLIAMTGGPAGAVQPGLAPIMHVFTDHPASVRRLLDTEVRVHLLSRVEVAGAAAWCCTDLN